jgi:hypothetical protein
MTKDVQDAYIILSSRLPCCVFIWLPDCTHPFCLISDLKCVAVRSREKLFWQIKGLSVATSESFCPL